MRLDANNLMEDSKLKVNKPKKDDGNKSLIAIVIAIAVTIIIICVIVVLMQMVTPINESLVLYVDGAETQMSDNLFIIEEDKVYVNVKEIASYVGYEAHSGEYKIEAEDSNKVFVECDEETASMFLDSDVISKVEPYSNGEYKNYTMSEPAIAVDGDIYVISDGIEIACNITLEYNQSKKTMTINTLDYIYEQYNAGVQSLGYVEADDAFENKKAILYDRIVVQTTDNRYGVIDSSGSEVIGTRYSYILFDEYNQEYTIKNTTGSYGISDINGETKITVIYDEIHNIDKENELYVVKSNNKYGVIDSNKNVIINTVYDEIGVDISPYTTSRTESASNNTTEETEDMKYIFFGSIIPVEQDGLWGFFDLNGNQLSSFKYSGIGCKAEDESTTSNKTSSKTTEETTTKTTRNLLSLEEYELLVVEQNGRYGLVDASGSELIQCQAEDMYSIISAGVETYYMVFNGITYNLETDLFVALGVEKKNE